MNGWIFTTILFFAGFGLGVLLMSLLNFVRDERYPPDEHECNGIHHVNIKGLDDA